MKKCINKGKDMERDLVSVIIPYYNNEKSIIRAIKSVVNQTYKNVEIILVDDGSIDKSYSLVNEYIKDLNSNINIINITQKNSGPSVARNRGIKLAKGKFIAFLDADDSWKNYKIENQIKVLKCNPNIDLLGCNFNIINLKSNTVDRKIFIKKPLEKISFRKLLYKHYYATPCVIVKNQVIKECGLFNENQKHMEDSLLFTRIARDFNAYMTNEFLVNTYKKPYGDCGLSSQLNEMQKGEINNYILLYRENKKSKNKLNFIEFMFCIIFSYIKFIKRKLVVLCRKNLMNAKNH